MASIVKKISVKSIFGDVKAALKKGTIQDGTAIIRVIGIASGTKTGNTQFGDWTALLGQFKGTNLVTGEQFTSGKCFLPESAMELIVPVVVAGNTAEFAVDIGVKENDSLAIGYEYTVTPLIQQGSTDAMERLESAVAETAALPAPTKKGAKKAA